MGMPPPSTRNRCSYCGKEFEDANKARPTNHDCKDYDPRIANIGG
jgi:hypothetical protein